MTDMPLSIEKRVELAIVSLVVSAAIGWGIFYLFLALAESSRNPPAPSPTDEVQRHLMNPRNGLVHGQILQDDLTAIVGLIREQGEKRWITLVEVENADSVWVSANQLIKGETSSMEHKYHMKRSDGHWTIFEMLMGPVIKSKSY
jgi:hypothetical protein